MQKLLVLVLSGLCALKCSSSDNAHMRPKNKYKTPPSIVHMVEGPVCVFAPWKGHSGAGALQLATPGKPGSTSSTAAPRLPPSFAPKQSSLSVCLLPSVVASETAKTNAASSKGGGGQSVARTAANITSKTLARFRSMTQTKQGGRMETQFLYSHANSAEGAKFGQCKHCFSFCFGHRH